MSMWVLITYLLIGSMFLVKVVFTFVAVILGFRDLMGMLRQLNTEDVDETDDGRVRQ